MKFKDKIRAFFYGRNGLDDLSRAILWPSLVVLLVSSFIGVAWLQSVLYLLGLAGFIYAYFRAFSKSLGKRRAENAAFLTMKNQLVQRFRQRKTHKFFRCKKCGTLLRVPKGKGKVSITCRQCGDKFIGKT